jgi:outer membrane protein TolC
MIKMSAMSRNLPLHSALWQKVLASRNRIQAVDKISMQWLFFVLFVLLLLVSAEQSFGKALTLTETLHYAMEHSPLLGNTLKSEQLSDLELSNRKAAFLPKLDLTSTHGLETNTPQTSNTDPWTSRYQLTLSENLYDNHVSITRYNRAKLEREIAEAKTLRERNALTLEIVRLFYELSKLRLRAESKEDQLKILKTQYESVSYQYRQGLKTRKDFLRLKSEVQLADIELRRAINDRDKVRFDLEKAMGAPPSESFEFEKKEPEEVGVPATPPSLEQTFEYRIAKMERDLAPFDVKLASRKYWPELNLTSSAYYGANNYIKSSQNYRELDSYGANILLSLNYNFWDWGILGREVEKARVGVEIADNNFRQKSLQMSNEIKAVMLDLGNLKANHLLTRELLENQENAFKILEREYRDGQTTYYDYITGLNDKLRAKNLFGDTRFDLATALAKYRYYERNLYATYFPR